MHRGLRGGLPGTWAPAAGQEDTMATSWLMDQQLPDGWEFARNRPHGLVEAVSRPTPTSLHVLVARDLRDLLEKVRAVSPAK